MKQILLLLLFFSFGLLHAQVNDDFTDGNFTNDPSWNGSNSGADFIISDGKLRSNSITPNASFFLSTANTLSIGTNWEFWVNLQFSTSGANYTDVYVIADKNDLKAASINGYFIRIGNTDDEISLYKRSGAVASSIKIIDGINGSIGSSNNTIKVRLTRDINGLFKLEREIIAPGSSYLTEGTVVDLTHTTSTHFGFSVQQSATSFFLKHFFDDVKIMPIVLDTNPPDLSAIFCIDSNTLEIRFSEAMDSLSVKEITNYSLNNAAVLRVSTTSDPSRFIVKLAAPLSTGTYNVQIVDVKDKNGNFIAGNGNKQFSYIEPYLSKLGDVVINEIFADPTPPIGLPSAEFVELRNNTNRTISLKNWKFGDTGNQPILGEVNIDPGSFLILCARADTGHFKLYGKTIGVSPWPSLNNAGDFLKFSNPENLVVDSVNFADTWHRNAGKRSGGWSLERKDPVSKCQGLLNWISSLDTLGGTPGKENSVFATGTNLSPLKADSLKHLSDTTIRLYFNKPLNSSTLVAQNFNLSPVTGTLRNIMSDGELKEVTLFYDIKFKPGTDYMLRVSDVKDCNGVLVSIMQDKLKFKTDTLQVHLPEKPDTGKVFITEIFADPSPEVHLPLVEFIEIYNPSKDTIDLDKWILNDPITKAIFPKQQIAPLEYIILCPAADTLSYIPYGKTIGLSPWPSLNNSSDLLILKSPANRLVDSVAYSDAWYHNRTKKTGGWTLEKINLKPICTDFFNWLASADTTGGTPGKRNSLDHIALRADSLQILSDTTSKIFFNKPINETLLLKDNFMLSPGNNLIKMLAFDREAKEVILTWQTRLQSGTEYQLSISNVKGCDGNHLLNTQLLKFKTAQIPAEKTDTGIVIISEIFADPSPEVGLPLAEFIELFNPGPDDINLSKWTLNDAVTKSTIPDLTIRADEYLILCPVADTLSFKKYGKVIGLNPWPALGNNSDQLTLKSFKQRLVDSVAYSDKWYKNQAKKSGGWSLEKSSLLSNSCNGFYIWVSSEDLSGGTPGKVNSRYKGKNNNQELKIDSIRYTSDSTIIIRLNSIADTSYLKPAFFSVDNGVGNAKILSLSDDYQRLSMGFSSKFKEGIYYTLFADSLFNCAGQKAKATDSQASFIIPVVSELDYPVVINEIFSDPSPSAGLPEMEFVELYNPTNKPVNLKGMIYGDEGSEYKFAAGQIAAGEFLILCQEKDTTNFVKFGSVHGLNIWPALNNDKDVLFLKNNKGRKLQIVPYNSSWYKDDEKKTGGYSLEMINPASICTGAQNWQASKDTLGGTPGKKNSVYNISTPEALKLQGSSLIDSLTILLTFNHAVDSSSASKPSNFMINNGVGEPAAVLSSASNFNTLLLKLKTAPAKGQSYRIDVQNIQDCSGSIISKELGQAEFILTKTISKSDILINEILFNPRAGGSDFVEIYNNAKHILDLSELSVATIIKDSISSVKRLSTSQLLMPPGQYFAISTDPDNLKKEYFIESPTAILKASSLPVFNDNIGSVILLNNKIIIEKFSYTDKMHVQLLKNFEGVSLERSSFERDANAPGNFRSATAAAGFATPGYKNSQYDPGYTGSEKFTLTSKTFSPDNDGFEDFLQINYKMENPGMVANVKIFNDNGILIKSLLKNSTLNMEGRFTWDGLNEHNTSPGTGIYIIYAEIFDSAGNVIKFRRTFALAVKL